MKTSVIINSSDVQELSEYINNLLLIPKKKIIVVAPAFRLAKQVIAFVKGNRRLDIDRVDVFTENGSRCIAIPIGTGAKARGFRPDVLAIFEPKMIPVDILTTVVSGMGAV